MHNDVHGTALCDVSQLRNFSATSQLIYFSFNLKQRQTGHKGQASGTNLAMKVHGRICARKVI